MDVLFAHPVAEAVRTRVEAELSRLETEHQVTVLFACESGSRAWGFASPDSDYDVRFLYVHRLPWYLQVEPGRDVIERPLDDELDVSGWELRKALYLLRRSNPTLLEWLDSPVVYRQQSAWVARLRALAPQFAALSKVRYHYLAMARKNYRGYLRGEQVRYKKYLYVLRPLLAVRWLDMGLGLPPMRFASLVQATVKDPQLLAEINDLLALKMAGDEALTGPQRPAIQRMIEQELLRAEHGEPDWRRPEGSRLLLDQLLQETVLQWDMSHGGA